MSRVGSSEQGDFFKAVDEDAREKERVWRVIDYDLGLFWPGGPGDPNYTLVRIDPERVELSRMFGSQDRRVWTRPVRGGAR